MYSFDLQYKSCIEKGKNNIVSLLSLNMYLRDK